MDDGTNETSDVEVAPNRTLQLMAINKWMESQGLPSVYDLAWQDDAGGATDHVKVTFDKGEVLLRIDPHFSPSPSISKVSTGKGLDKTPVEAFPVAERAKGEDDFGLTADQLKTAVQGFIRASTSEDRAEIDKLVGSAAELAVKLEALMPANMPMPPQVGPDGRVEVTPDFHTLGGSLELEHQAQARQQQQQAFHSVVDNVAGLAGAILTYIETWR